MRRTPRRAGGRAGGTAIPAPPAGRRDGRRRTRPGRDGTAPGDASATVDARCEGRPHRAHVERALGGVLRIPPQPFARARRRHVGPLERHPVHPGGRDLAPADAPVVERVVEREGAAPRQRRGGDHLRRRTVQPAPAPRSSAASAVSSASATRPRRPRARGRGRSSRPRPPAQALSSSRWPRRRRPRRSPPSPGRWGSRPGRPCTSPATRPGVSVSAAARFTVKFPSGCARRGARRGDHGRARPGRIARRRAPHGPQLPQGGPRASAAPAIENHGFIASARSEVRHGGRAVAAREPRSMPAWYSNDASRVPSDRARRTSGHAAASRPAACRAHAYASATWIERRRSHSAAAARTADRASPWLASNDRDLQVDVHAAVREQRRLGTEHVELRAARRPHRRSRAASRRAS